MDVKKLITVRSALWLLLQVLLCGQSLQAQSYITDVRKLSVEDGLSSRFVNTIYKDSQGFMWIGTNYGLNRYDGYEFKLYTSENSPLSSNSIREIYEDKAQRLWIIHGNLYDRYKLSDIDILDLRTGKIQNFEDVFKDRVPFSVKNITYIYSNAEKDLWITTNDGTVYRYLNKRFERMFSIHKEEDLEIFYADDQCLWLYRNAFTLSKVNTRGDIIKNFRFKSALKNVGIDKNNNLWVAQPEKKSLFQVSGEHPGLQTVSLQPINPAEDSYTGNYLRIFYMNPANDLIWWHQEDKTSFFLVIHPLESTVIDLQDKIKNQLTYGNPGIIDIYFESAERTWVASEDGIFIITLKKNKFKKLLSSKSKKYSTRGIVADQSGTIYVNSYHERIKILPYKDTVRYQDVKTDGHWLSATRDRYGKLWFGGDGAVTEKYDPLKQHSQYYIHSDTSYNPSSQWSIIHDKKDRAWIGTSSGLYYLEPEKTLYHKFNRYNIFSQLGESTVYHLYEDEKGIWIAASSGLYLLEPDKGITVRYAKEENAPFYIPHSYILHFYRDASGIFWLATKGGGLIRLNPEDGSYQQFTTADGLSNNIINAVYEDDYGKLWLPSNYGLMQFDKSSYQVNTWLTGDGIAHEEFNIASHYRSDDDLLYFGGLSGITVFDPADFTAEIPAPAPLQIIHCQVLNAKTGALTDKTATVTESGMLTLFPSDRSFIIEFALLNYENSQHNNYAYTIEGLDKGWTAIRENSLRINALPYGSYVLRIKGQGIKGESAANELAISILVNKPFYLKNWFIISCILVLGLLLYGIFRWRLQNLKQAKIRLQQTVRERTQEIQKQKDKMEELNATQSRWFTNIAHELRTPLTLILGPIRQFLKTHSGKTGVENIQMAEKSSMGLLRLVNEILDISRLESNRLELVKKPTNLSRLVRESASHFDSFAIQKGVTLTTYIPDDCDLNIDKNRIQKILINLISNALKFTHAGGKIMVSVAYEAGKGVKISVTDTGDGIPKKDLPHVFERYYQASHPGQINQGGAGIGLALSLELARLHDGDLSVESESGKGSTFSLYLPQNLVIGSGKPAAIKTLTTPSLIPDIRAKSSAKTANGQPNKPLILLVEDNPDMRQYILSFMSRDYKIIEAADGLEALKHVEEAIPNLIISDIMMPRMDGISLAKMLKSDERFKNIPFITLTAKTGESDKITTLRVGIDDYLTKPFNAEELEARTANLIRNSRERALIAQTDPNQITAPSYQENQLDQMKAFVMSRLNSNSLSVNDLASSQSMSLSSLSRLLKKNTGLNPSQFIREIRLQQARRLLEARQYPTVLEVVYAVGFENASHFARRYTERFGKKPSEYL